jgi:hypothetical protein
MRAYGAMTVFYGTAYAAGHVMAFWPICQGVRSTEALTDRKHEKIAAGENVTNLLYISSFV